jgi:hypothetical protein
MTEDVEGLPRMTREQAVTFLKGRGYPVSMEAFIRGNGPIPMGKWGRRFLYEPRTLLAWAERRIQPVCYPDVTPDMNDRRT